MTTAAKACGWCGKAIRGRADKKFCGDQCRNNHNNRVNNRLDGVVRKINLQLRRNRRILACSLAANKRSIRTSRYLLSSKGYLFHYYTHTYTDNRGKTFYCCYEFGYTLLPNEQVIVIRQKHMEEEDVKT